MKIAARPLIPVWVFLWCCAEVAAAQPHDVGAFSRALSFIRANHNPQAGLKVRCHIEMPVPAALDDEARIRLAALPEARVRLDQETGMMRHAFASIRFTRSPEGDLRREVRNTAVQGDPRRTARVTIWTSECRVDSSSAMSPQATVRAWGDGQRLDASEGSTARRARLASMEYCDMVATATSILADSNDGRLSVDAATGEVTLSSESFGLSVRSDSTTGEVSEIAFSDGAQRRSVFRFRGRHEAAALPARYPREVWAAVEPPPAGSTPRLFPDVYDPPVIVGSVDPSLFEWQSIARTALLADEGRVINQDGSPNEDATKRAASVASGTEPSINPFIEADDGTIVPRPRATTHRQQWLLAAGATSALLGVGLWIRKRQP